MLTIDNRHSAVNSVPSLLPSERYDEKRASCEKDQKHGSTPNLKDTIAGYKQQINQMKMYLSELEGTMAAKVDDPIKEIDTEYKAGIDAKTDNTKED